MQKALVKKKLIYFTKTIPKFSESEELKKKKKRKDKNQTQTSHHSLTQEKQQEKKWANK